MTEQTVDPSICSECGYKKDSEQHKRGIGLHGHSNEAPEVKSRAKKDSEGEDER